VLEPEAGPADPARPGLDDHGLAEEERRSIGDLGLRKDQARGSTGLALEPLADAAIHHPTRADSTKVRYTALLT